MTNQVICFLCGELRDAAMMLNHARIRHNWLSPQRAKRAPGPPALNSLSGNGRCALTTGPRQTKAYRENLLGPLDSAAAGTIVLASNPETERSAGLLNQVSCGTESAVGKVGLGERHGSTCLQGKDGHKSDTSSRSESQQNCAGLGAEWGIPPAGIARGRSR